jgi:hypothetical protein
MDNSKLAFPLRQAIHHLERLLAEGKVSPGHTLCWWQGGALRPIYGVTPVHEPAAAALVLGPSFFRTLFRISRAGGAPTPAALGDRPMQLIDLVRRCEKAYARVFPESSLIEQVDRQGVPLNPPPGGDTLALFIVQELHETYEPDADDRDQLATARDAMQDAVDELDAVIAELDEDDGSGEMAPPLGAAAQEREGGTPGATPVSGPLATHKQTRVAWQGREAEVDEELAPLILALWKAGIDTLLSCQENRPGVAWICFPTARDAKNLLDAVAVCPDQKDLRTVGDRLYVGDVPFGETLYGRISRCGGDDDWQ